MMKRIALFAHYDRDGIVDDYVIYYLRSLKRVAGRILFVSDCALREGEAAKLEGLAELVSADPHGEYDFGSWKRAFQFLNGDLTGWDELILANDSCYAPIYPFEGAFERMREVACDVWGPTSNEKNGKFDHLSSYFLVFRRSILQDEDFVLFFSRIKPQASAIDVIVNYEIGLSQLLAAKGYRFASLTPSEEIGSFSTTRYVHDILHSYKLCWLKVRLVRDNPRRAARLAEALDKIDGLYPRSYINNHMIRILGTAYPQHHFYLMGGDWRFRRYGVEISCRLKKGKPHKQSKRRFDWMKFYTHIFGVQVFAFAWPVRRSCN